MKKLLFLVALCCFCTGVASAQMIEIVHLKNGSQIRGIITEQVPNKHLKIQTFDGSVFVYSYDEIEKISKETPEQRNGSAYNYGQNRFRRQQINSSFRPHYEGSVDVGYSIGVGEIAPECFNISTSHGYRVIPYLYIGAGAGFNYYHTLFIRPQYGIPIFADFRGYFTQQTLKPFLNFRVGYSVGDIQGIYLSPSVGINFKKLDVSFGYTYQKANFETYDDDYNDYYSYGFGISAITIKVGIRF